MMPSKKISLLFMIGSMAFVMAACSGVKGTSSGTGTGGGTGSFTVGGTITNLVGSGLVLTDNSTDTLTITKTGTVQFTFSKPVGGAYDVEIQTQPTNPAQTCTLTGNKGTATANVTTVAIACTTNPVTATIGGTLTGLAQGASVILQNNGGDSLTLTANGPFTFKTPVTGPTDAYAVAVGTQPSTPNQICTVTNGSGTATANVTNVGVNCVLAYTIGGSLTGLVGSGFVLLDTVTVPGSTTPIITEQLPIKATNGNAPFTFTQDVPTGATYTVSIYSQPTGPAQTCVVTPSTATGTAMANVTSVVVTCPAVTFSVGGSVVGLAGVPSNNGPITDNSFVINNNNGNSLIINQNGPFTFATPEALNDTYTVSFEHATSSQWQGCTRWNYTGTVSANVNNIVIDCGHDDWTWINGSKTAGTIAAPQYGSFPQNLPGTTPNPYTNTPGARNGAAGWVDKFGNLFLFGGDGWELAGNPSPDTLDAPMNDMWVCVMAAFGTTGPDACEWYLVGAYGTSGSAIYLNAQFEGQQPSYPALNTPVTPPLGIGARLGAATWTDLSGNFWIFGGSNGAQFRNDLWKFDTSGFDGSIAAYYTNPGTWTLVRGSSSTDQASTATLPGARTNAATWTDASGNFWLFGGYGYDAQSPSILGFLNDLWMYNPGSNTWTLVSGSNKANQPGNYGTQGTAASGNMPGGRQEAAMWIDATGNLWLFGGEGEDSVSTVNGILNDLWMYNVTGKQWTWVTGSTKANQTGTYPLQPLVGPVTTTGAAGTCGLPAGNAPLACNPISVTGLMPGSRWGANSWIDKGGNLWLFGGWGLDDGTTNGNGALNDLWVYTPNANPTQPGTWVWVKGSNTGGVPGVYGVRTIPYVTNQIYTPGARSNATVWLQTVTITGFPPSQQLWMFGGLGNDSTTTTGHGFLNDQWRYLIYQDF
jgi:hypothetical protein